MIPVSDKGNIWDDYIFVALFGDEQPMTAPDGPPSHIGRSIVRVDPRNWSIHPFVSYPPVRPIDIRFNPVDNILYILDFGHFEIDSKKGIISNPNSEVMESNSRLD